jgi:hypothetical protein
MAALDANRERALDLAVSQIEKQFGKGAIMKLGDHAAAPDIPVVSTGSLGLDIALGVGGLPRGRVVEIYGPESSGKTTLALQVVACAQQLGGVCAFVDVARTPSFSAGSVQWHSCLCCSLGRMRNEPGSPAPDLRFVQPAKIRLESQYLRAFCASLVELSQLCIGTAEPEMSPVKVWHVDLLRRCQGFSIALLSIEIIRVHEVNPTREIRVEP